MIRIAIILGSTRPNRIGEAVARWTYEQSRKRTDAEFELVDLQQVNLPFLDESIPPSAGRYANEHTRAWAQRIASYDGFVFVTPEYNHGPPAALKNALDYLYAEWNNKAAGFVSYGSAGGARAVEHLRGILAELQVATVRAQVMFHLGSDFEKYTVLKEPDATKVKALNTMLDQLVAWGAALRTVRVH
jgi:NAD(P)H-dependent FMN reductase